MNLKDLHTFLSVAELGSVTLAAEALGRSQPSVSRCIKDLEDTLGFALLERVGRRVSLSPEGAAFEEEARRLVAAFNDLAPRTLARAAGMAQVMTISATPALGTGLIPLALADWPQEDRPADIRIMQGPPNAVAQDLIAGRARIGLASLPLNVPGVTCLRAYRAPLVAVLPEGLGKQFPLGEAVTLRALSQAAPLVSMLDQTRLQGRIAHQLSATGVTPPRAIHVNSSVTALQLVRTTGACAVIEPVTAFGMDMPGVTLRPLAEPIEFSLGFFAADGLAAARAAQRFFDLCEAVLMRSIPQISRVDTDAPPTTTGDER